MVLPLLPLAVAGLAGTVGGMGLSQFIGGGKKDSSASVTTTTTYGQVYHSPGEVYSPQMQYAPQTGYSYTGATYIINSPYASSKKSAALEQSSSPAQEGYWEVPQAYTTSPQVSAGSGLDSTTLLLIAGLGVVGLIGFGLVSGRK